MLCHWRPRNDSLEHKIILLSNFHFTSRNNGEYYIECGKPLNETVAAFLAKGFKTKSDPKNPNLVSFVGDINGVKHEGMVVATK